VSARLWQPTASREAIRARARLLQHIRAFFADVGVMEVETPIASYAAATDPVLESLVTSWNGPGQGRIPLYLQTSPEFAMKRLLVAGVGPIYQICKVFRDAERGRLHNPEFTLLEWYRPGWSHQELIGEVAALVRAALEQPELPYEILTYRDLFVQRLGLDPWRAGRDELRRMAKTLAIGGAQTLELDQDGWLDLLLTQCLERDLGVGRLTFVCDYPPTQAAMARVRSDPYPAAERFELYFRGIELANGFQELTDADEQRVRFAADLQRRSESCNPAVPVDNAFLQALDVGMPATSGVALGVDRLLMALTGSRSIDEVLAFPIERA
jgi:lysyl-tRNA synthetase class 2